MLDWLGKLLPENIKISINFSPKLTINHIKINSDNTSKEPVSLEKDKLIINDATTEGAKIATKVIKQLPTHIRHNDIVIEDTNLEHYTEIDKQLSTSSFKNQFNRYKKIIPKDDRPILEVAILVKNEYDAGKNVAPIKGQAVQRFGPRASMICNLYSSMYFETLIEPLYKLVQSGAMALDEYLDTYEMIVTESPLAMFVGVGTPQVKVKQQLLDKIRANKQAEVGYLNIHGIGKTNINLIKLLLEDADVKALFIEEPTLQQNDKTIKATVYL